MKKTFFFLLSCACNLAFSQINETFEDGNFTENPTWSGTTENFIVTADSSKQLQSNTATAGISYLTAPSEAIDNAVWEFWAGIKYNPSSSNFISFYLVSDRANISEEVNGYYVQIGNTNDEVSLYSQVGNKKTKIIDGRDKILDSSDNSVYVKVTRDIHGNWALYSRLPQEQEYQLEGETKNIAVKYSAYVGILVRNSSTTGNAYFADNLMVTGEAAKDTDSPTWLQLTMIKPNKLHSVFSEPISIENASFSLIDLNDNSELDILQAELSENKMELTLTTATDFEDKRLYELSLNNITDLAGNILGGVSSKTIGQLEIPKIGDLTFNEIMFHQPEAGAEYVEIHNISDKLINMSGLIITTRKNDGRFNSGNIFPEGSTILPDKDIALCSDNILVAEYHNCPVQANIMGTKWAQTLNNEGTTVYLIAQSDSNILIFDSLYYSVKWHHPLIKNPQGVALEKINPLLPTQNPDSWHSASSDCFYGTPGYQNSQYREIIIENEIKEKAVWLEPEAFTPDGDGFEDVCFIHYTMPDNGFMANISIYTPTGLLLYKISENILLSTKGFLTWDGMTKLGKNANVGVYVLVFDAFNAETGKTLKRKLPIVVGAR